MDPLAEDGDIFADMEVGGKDRVQCYGAFVFPTRAGVRKRRRAGDENALVGIPGPRLVWVEAR
jgi:hypothetical protein